ncbi:toll/interleukin-1 receptor domain-containing protein [Bacillus cereus]|nr:toll/interleukin-1 receptor domain-containing protein [Bacillus cereus]MEB9569115.1 toll/interleukin-1 receptor domain-containing protein [Bacillus cereus]
MNEIEKNNDMVDFFISYNHKDEKYAEWISWILEQAGHTTIIQAWDFKRGNNFAILMHQAASHSRHTLALLSDNYLGSQFTLPEWIAAFSDDPTGERQKLIPVRIEDIKLEGLLKSILYIDLVGLDQEQATAAILEGVQTKRKKTTTPPPFPGIIQKKT